VAFRRAEGEEVPPVKCFGFVQTFDEKPRRRLWELMKSHRRRRGGSDANGTAQRAPGERRRNLNASS
jgi:hypothetical protein